MNKLNKKNINDNIIDVDELPEICKKLALNNSVVLSTYQSFISTANKELINLNNLKLSNDVLIKFYEKYNNSEQKAFWVSNWLILKNNFYMKHALSGGMELNDQNNFINGKYNIYKRHEDYLNNPETNPFAEIFNEILVKNDTVNQAQITKYINSLHKYNIFKPWVWKIVFPLLNDYFLKNNNNDKNIAHEKTVETLLYLGINKDNKISNIGNLNILTAQDAKNKDFIKNNLTEDDIVWFLSEEFFQKLTNKNYKIKKKLTEKNIVFYAFFVQSLLNYNYDLLQKHKENEILLKIINEILYLIDKNKKYQEYLNKNKINKLKPLLERSVLVKTIENNNITHTKQKIRI
jgi:hypothetical protein